MSYLHLPTAQNVADGAHDAVSSARGPRVVHAFGMRPLVPHRRVTCIKALGVVVELVVEPTLPEQGMCRTAIALLS